MARRRKKGRGKRGSKAFPLLALAPVAPGIKAAWDNRGSGPLQAVRSGIGAVTGIDIMGEVPIQYNTALKTLGIVVISRVGHRVAAKAGINRQLKKLSFGYIEL